MIACALGGLEDGVDVEEILAIDAGIVVGALGAIGTVFGAAAGFDAEECAELHFRGVVVLAVDGLGLEEEFGEGLVVDRAKLGDGPVVDWPLWFWGLDTCRSLVRWEGRV